MRDSEKKIGRIVIYPIFLQDSKKVLSRTIFQAKNGIKQRHLIPKKFYNQLKKKTATRALLNNYCEFINKISSLLPDFLVNNKKRSEIEQF